jgi:2-(3-amino-3-carboxypropyl)histidine synthase
MRVLLQFPEGLKRHAFSYAAKLEAEGHEVVLSASACYGGCDLALDEAKAIGASEIVHFGHAKFPIPQPVDIPVEYVEWRFDVPQASLDSCLQALSGYTKIALVTTVQHVHELERMKSFFEKSGIDALTRKGALCAYEGQVLGCDGTAASIPEAEAVLFVGDGMFHPLAIDEDRPVYVLNPYNGKVSRINEEIGRLRKRRDGALAACIEAKKFAVLVSIKPGQSHLKVAQYAKRLLEDLGREAHILVGNELSPLSLQNFMHFEAYVNTACPRLADDWEMFGKPIINLDQLERMAKMLKDSA